MSRILCSWEMGADLGHVAGFQPLALALAGRGHDVRFALRDLAGAERLLGSRGFRLLQAPVVTAPPRNLPRAPASYAEILLMAGFTDADTLTALLRAWLQLFELLAPDLLLADHSPAALLAARIAGLRRAAYGTSFTIPPRVAPMPNMRPWLAVPPERLARAEVRALAAANQAAARLGAKPLRALHEIFEVDETFLCGFAELDHYRNRDGARYWGARFNLADGVAVDWPPRAQRRVFAYLKPRHRDFAAVLKTLSELRASSCVFAPGLSEDEARRLASLRVRVLREPVRLETLREGCTLAVCHGGNTAAAFLLAGVPLLVLPTQLEQYLLAKRVEELGAGRLVNPEKPAPDYRRLFAELLRNPSYRTKARALAAKYRDYDAGRAIARIAERVAELLPLKAS